MIDWPLVLSISLGGYGICIFVLVILAVLVWLMGFTIQKAQGKNKAQASEKKG